MTKDNKKSKYLSHKPLSEYQTRGANSLINVLIFFGIILIICGISLWYSDYSSNEYEPNYLLYSLFILSGIFFICIGGRIKYKNNNIENDRYKKMTKRKKVDAEVFDFVGFRENGSKGEGYEIWAITKKDIFISPTIVEDVPKYVRIGDHIPVYVNPNDPEEYYMDIDNIY